MKNQVYLKQTSEWELKEYLRHCTFGDMETDASVLSNEQQSQLFDYLDRLHKQPNLDVRGLWGIISLNFTNRSGLSLMMMFNNSNVQTSQIFHKKAFLTNIQHLQNHHLTINLLRRLLQILNISIQKFIEGFQKWKQWKNHIITQQSKNKKTTVMLNQKIFQQNDYDSEPNLNYNPECVNYSDQSYLSDRQIKNQGKQISVLQIQQANQQDTISLKRIIHQNFEKIPQRPMINRRRGKRPSPHKKKQRLKKQIKQKQSKLIKFVSERKNVRKLKQNYKFIQYLREEQNDQIEEETPMTIKKKGRHKQSKRTGRKQHFIDKPRRNTNTNQLKQNKMDEEDQSSELINDQSSISSQQQHVSQMIQQNQRNIKNKNKRQLKKNGTRIKQQQQESVVQYMQIENQKIINQSIQNMRIRKIQFPKNIDDLQKKNVLTEDDKREEFNIHDWCEYLLAMNSKEKWKLIKQMADQNDQTSFQTVMKVYITTKINQFNEFTLSYLNPILFHKFTKIVGKIINQIMNALYRSSEQSAFIGIFESCKILVLLHKQVSERDENGAQKLTYYLFECLATFIRGIMSGSKRSDSLINLPTQLDTVNSTIRIRLEEEHHISTLLIAITMIVHGFLKPIFELTDNSTLILTINQQLLACYNQKIKQKARHTQCIWEIYSQFNIPISTKQQFEFVLLYVKQINLHEPQPQYFYEIMPSLTRSFLQQKIHQNTQTFNYKHIINYLSLNQFMKKCKQAHTQLGYQIVLRTYEVLLECDKFHNEFAISYIINYVKTIDSRQKRQQSFIYILLDILIECYQIKRRQQSFNSIYQLKNINNKKNSETLNIIQSQLFNFIQAICQKMTIIVKNISDKADQKRQKFQRIICKYIQQFIDDQKTYLNIEHFLFSLKIGLTIIYPLFNKLDKQNEFYDILGDKLSKLFLRIFIIKRELQQQNERSFLENDQIDESQRAFLKKQQKDRLLQFFIAQIKIIVAQSNVVDQMPKQFLNIPILKSHVHPNVFYQVQGIVAALGLLQQATEDASKIRNNQNKNSINNLKTNIFRFLSIHATRIQLLKKVNFSTTSNAIIIQFLRGFLNTINQFSFCKEINIKLKQLGHIVKTSIYDIFFIGIICQKDTKNLRKLLHLSNKMIYFKECDHLLSKLRFDDNKQFNTEECINLKSILQLMEHAKNNSQVWSNMINKLKSPILQICLSLYQQYQKLNWIQLRSDLACNIINIFIFLIRVEAHEDVQKAYRQYIILADSHAYQNISHSHKNLLRGLQIKEDALKCVVQLFKAAYFKRKQTLDKTRQLYIDYLINSVLMKKTSTGFSLSKLQILISTLNSQSEVQPDSFSLMMIEDLYTKLLSASVGKQIKEQAVNLFFIMLKKYPKLRQAHTNVFKSQYQKIDKILRMQQGSNQIQCTSLEQAIKKYILKENCQFGMLYTILMYRSRDDLFRKDSKIINEIKQIVQKCLQFLRMKNKTQDYQDLIRQFEQLQIHLMKSENMIKQKFSLQQMFGGSQLGGSRLNECSSEQNKVCN